LTLDMRKNVRSVGELSDFSDCEIVGFGHGEPLTRRSRGPEEVMGAESLTVDSTIIKQCLNK
jgi:hypothetical protein